MLLHDARREARTTPDGDAVLLEAQDRSRWDKAQIAEGLSRIEAALHALERPSTYAVQAAIAALHMRAQRYEDTDWPQIAGLYEVLMRIHPSPVIELNHAVAVSMVDGPERALRLVDSIDKRGELNGYHMLPAVRGDLLRRLGRRDEAIAAYRQALKGADLEPERRFLAARLGRTQLIKKIVCRCRNRRPAVRLEEAAVRGQGRSASSAANQRYNDREVAMTHVFSVLHSDLHGRARPSGCTAYRQRHRQSGAREGRFRRRRRCGARRRRSAPMQILPNTRRSRFCSSGWWRRSAIPLAGGQWPGGGLLGGALLSAWGLNSTLKQSFGRQTGASLTVLVTAVSAALILYAVIPH